MLKAIKIRLYPNNNQEVQINKLLGCYRFVYNNCLAFKKEKYDENKTSLNLKQLGDYFHNTLTKSEEYQWLNEQNTKVLKQAIINMLDAYNRFFKGKGKVGFPEFKSKHDNKLSCRFPIEAISKRNDYQSNSLSLANIRGIKFKCSDKYKKYLTKYKNGIRSATLTKTSSGNYFLSILIEGEVTKQLPTTKNIVGIDLGVKDFVISSEGEVFDNLHFHKKEEKKIKRLQKQLSRKTKGSRNRNKARIRLAKKYEKITNQKQNYLHEISNKLLNENQVIVMEDLNVSGMLKNHKLAKSIQEMSFYEFRRMLAYKCEWYNRELVIIDRFFASSKLCNVCGFKNKLLSLSDRSWVCPECRTEHSRDLNAALNILSEGKRIIGSDASNLTVGHRMPEFTLVEIGSVDDPCDSNVTLLKSIQSLKQEIEINENIGNTNFL